MNIYKNNRKKHYLLNVLETNVSFKLPLFFSLFYSYIKPLSLKSGPKKFKNFSGHLGIKMMLLSNSL